jgi:hypothetical protein
VQFTRLLANCVCRFLLSLLQISNNAACFDPTSHLHVHKLVCTPFKVTSTAEGPPFCSHRAAEHVIRTDASRWSSFVSCFHTRHHLVVRVFWTQLRGVFMFIYSQLSLLFFDEIRSMHRILTLTWKHANVCLISWSDVLAADPKVPGSIPGTVRFSE